MKQIDTTVQRDYDHEGHTYGRGDRLSLPLLDAVKLANSGVVRLGYRKGPSETSVVTPRRSRRRTKTAEAVA
jgi:hypothetical protein